MKKYLIIITIIAALFFSACNPNEELYNEHDEVISNFYNENIEYIFTVDDYKHASYAAMDDAVTSEDSAYAGYIKTFESFNSHYTASDYIPAVLADNFIALDSSSTAQVTYNQYNEDFDFEENYFGNITKKTFFSLDYAALGLSDLGSFTTSEKPEDYLPDYLAILYPEAEANSYVKLYYKYPDVDTKVYDLYKFDGTFWSQVENYYILNEADYLQMGDPGPGTDNRFTESYPAENYIIQFMNSRFIYSQNGDYRLLVYENNVGSSAVTTVKKFIYNDGWELYNPAEMIESQFVHLGTKWVFDPTVRLFILADDFQLIVDYVKDNIGEDYVSDYGNNDFYTGASAYYNNFDIRISKRREYASEDYPESMSDEDASALIWERLYEGLVILLGEKYPDAVSQVEGVDVHYVLTFDVFNDNYAHVIYTVEYKCTASGSPATFEIIKEAYVPE